MLIAPRPMKILCSIAFALTIALAGCRAPNPIAPKADLAPAASATTDAPPLSLIPAPYALQRKPGYFELRDGMALRIHVAGDPGLIFAAEWLRDTVLRTRGIHLNIEPLDPSKPATDPSKDPGIDVMSVKPPPGNLNAAEEYGLEVSSDGIRL